MPRKGCESAKQWLVGENFSRKLLCLFNKLHDIDVYVLSFLSFFLYKYVVENLRITVYVTKVS